MLQLATSLRVAVVHEWLVDYSGSERILEQLLRIFPQADLYSVVDFLPENLRFFTAGRRAKTTFIQKLPFARTKFRAYLPLMPLAIEQLDLGDYDVIVSNTHAVAKGVLTGPDQIHISYIHSPMRYAWDLQHQYLKESNLQSGLAAYAARLLLHYLRIWDARTAVGVDALACNSDFIRRRIQKAYGRAAEVIFPPVDLAGFQLRENKADYYVTASRMVPYKKMDLIVEAFALLPDKRLVVIGDGPDAAKIRAKAGPNVELLGHQPVEVLREHLGRAKAFLFAAEEDFGITPVEAQACGTPVIAYGKGGVLETIRGLEDPAPTGLFYAEQSAAALVEAIRRFEMNPLLFQPAACRKNAERFSVERFRADFETLVARALPKNGAAEQEWT